MTPSITGSKLESLKSLLGGARMVSVAAHVHPDGDAVGSTAAMCSYLREIMGKDAVGILPEVPPANIAFIIPENVPYIFGDKDPEAAAARIAASDLIIVLDCSGIMRTEGLSGPISASRAPKVLIDHHLNPQEQEFSLVFSTPEISSASELLYWILKDLEGSAEKLPEACRSALCAGMTTDTNNFANSVFPSTFRMASELIAAGTDRDAIIGHIYTSFTLDGFHEETAHHRILQCLRKSVNIVVGDLDESRGERAETCVCIGINGEGDDGDGTTVEVAVAHDDLGLVLGKTFLVVTPTAAEFKSRLVGFGT